MKALTHMCRSYIVAGPPFNLPLCLALPRILSNAHVFDFIVQSLHESISTRCVQDSQITLLPFTHTSALRECAWKSRAAWPSLKPPDSTPRSQKAADPRKGKYSLKPGANKMYKFTARVKSLWRANEKLAKYSQSQSNTHC